MLGKQIFATTLEVESEIMAHDTHNLRVCGQGLLYRECMLSQGQHRGQCKLHTFTYICAFDSLHTARWDDLGLYMLHLESTRSLWVFLCSIIMTVYLSGILTPVWNHFVFLNYSLFTCLGWECPQCCQGIYFVFGFWNILVFEWEVIYFY